MTAAKLLNLIASNLNYKKCLFFTSRTTGTPVIEEIKIQDFTNFLSIRCKTDLPHYSEEEIKYMTIDNSIALLKKLDLFEIAFVDPFHTYSKSFKMIKFAESRLEDNSWMIVHDCMPTSDLVNETFIEGVWCGMTFAAFRDLALQLNRAWFVVDADFGVGVMGPRNTAKLIKDDINFFLKTKWRLSSIKKKKEIYKKNSYKIMRSIKIEKFNEVFKNILGNKKFTF